MTVTPENLSAQWQPPSELFWILGRDTNVAVQQVDGSIVFENRAHFDHIPIPGIRLDRTIEIYRTARTYLRFRPEESGDPLADYLDDGCAPFASDRFMDVLRTVCTSPYRSQSIPVRAGLGRLTGKVPRTINAFVPDDTIDDYFDAEQTEQASQQVAEIFDTVHRPRLLNTKDEYFHEAAVWRPLDMPATFMAGTGVGSGWSPKVVVGDLLLRRLLDAGCWGFVPIPVVQGRPLVFSNALLPVGWSMYGVSRLIPRDPTKDWQMPEYSFTEPLLPRLRTEIANRTWCGGF